MGINPYGTRAWKRTIKASNSPSVKLSWKGEVLFDGGGRGPIWCDVVVLDHDHRLYTKNMGSGQSFSSVHSIADQRRVVSVTSVLWVQQMRSIDSKGESDGSAWYAWVPYHHSCRRSFQQRHRWELCDNRSACSRVLQLVQIGKDIPFTGRVRMVRGLVTADYLWVLLKTES